MDSLYGCRAVGREGLGTLLADAFLPIKCHPVTSWERLSATNTHAKTNKTKECQEMHLTVIYDEHY